jgi:ketosteroid isomerase-like protein
MTIMDSDAEAPARVRAMFEAFDAKDVSALASFMTDDGSVADYRSYIDVTPVYA